MSKKNILFYIPTIVQKDGGIRQYAFNILKAFSENYSQDYTFYIYHKRKDPLFLEIAKRQPNFVLIETHFFAKFKIKTAVFFNKILYKLSLEKSSLSLNFLDFLLKKHKINIIHCPYQFIPKTKLAKLICTLHDVQQLHFPDFFTKEEIENRTIVFPDFINRSDAIIVSFDHVKKDLIHFFNADKNKIQTLLIGINNLWIVDYFNKSISFGLNIKSKSYILYPANSWKHKNHIGLFESLRILKKKNRIVHLILTGDFDNENGKYLIDKIYEFGLENQIIVKGIVDQDELFKLYMNCVGVVIPTLYEAGSYPLYESIFIEKSVICSNVTSLPETIGNNEFVFNPLDYDDMANKIDKLYFDNSYREKSILNSKKRKVELQSKNTVNNLYKLYDSLQ
jgi:glycosyltransferase involved in cell wall biosynthesis